MRTTPSGQQVATFSLATNRAWNDKSGGKKEDVQFHNIVVWGRLAEIAGRFLMKGGVVLIEGRLQNREWTDKQGQKRRTTEIVAESLQLGPRPFGSQQGGFSAGRQDGATGSAAPQSGFAPASSELQSASDRPSPPRPLSETGRDGRGEPASPAQEIPSIDLDAGGEAPADFFPEEGGIKPEDLNF